MSRGEAGTGPSLWCVPGRYRTLVPSPRQRYAPPGPRVCQQWPPPQTQQPPLALKHSDFVRSREEKSFTKDNKRQKSKRQEKINTKERKKSGLNGAECWTYVLHWNHPAAGPEAVRRHSDWCKSLGWAGLSVCSKPSGSYSEQQMTVTSLVPWSPGVQIIKSMNYERAWVIFMFQFPRIVYYQLATSENSCIKVLK